MLSHRILQNYILSIISYQTISKLHQIIPYHITSYQIISFPDLFQHLRPFVILSTQLGARRHFQVNQLFFIKFYGCRCHLQYVNFYYRCYYFCDISILRTSLFHLLSFHLSASPFCLWINKFVSLIYRVLCALPVIFFWSSWILKFHNLSIHFSRFLLLTFLSTAFPEHSSIS